MTANDAPIDVYSDPFDLEIDTDPYPTFRRLRDEAPLHFNEKHDFYALSRFEDVEECERDYSIYLSGKGAVLEVIQAVTQLGVEWPPGIIHFEDPPAHTAHRGLLSRVFTPRRMNEIEPQVRAFSAASLDPLVGSGGFDSTGTTPCRPTPQRCGVGRSRQSGSRTSAASVHRGEDSPGRQVGNDEPDSGRGGNVLTAGPS